MITFDIEANNLLNNETIDYLASPFKLKDTFELHCIVVEDHESGDIIAFYDGKKYELDGRSYAEFDTKYKVTYTLENYEPIQYIHKQLDQFCDYIHERKPHSVIGHNIINYDLLVTKLIYGMDYTVYPDTWDGLDITIEDTLVFSKKLNPDRFGGHSLDNLSTKVGLRKIDFRPDIDKALKFKTFAADMLYYCIRDVKVNTLVFKYLQKEAGNWDWKDAIDLEKAVAEIVTRQEHRGFKFDKNLAESNIKELDNLMDERSTRVTPVIPNKPATKKFMSDYTPPVRQILKNGQPTSYLLKFVDKIGATLSGDVGEYKLKFNEVVYDVPLPLDIPLLTEQEAGINDTTHIKEWIVREFGWNPSEYKEKDITVDSKKIKLSPEKLEATIDRYVDQTINSAFCKDRCEFLKTSPKKLKDTLIKRCESGRGVKVLTNPNFTKGQEKEICPDLERIADKFPFAKDVVEYLTYKHRRNSILGGGLEWDDEEEAEKGYMSYIRDDGRIATPADTCGCATSRFKHKVVANIPRTTSLYGRKMRELFGVDDGFIQFGYDFDSLEARIESHYCYKYDPTKEYCNALILEKPNDVHSMMARRITEVINRKFERGSAKSVKYGCLPVDNSEVLTDSGWKKYEELCLGQNVLTYDKEEDKYVWKPISKLWHYSDADVYTLENKHISIESTLDHNWYGYKRVMKGSGKQSVRYRSNGFNTTEDINSECAILHASTYSNEDSTIKPHQAALVAWLLSDGYYKWSDNDEITSSSHGKRKGIVASICQADHKYQKEVVEVLTANGMEYTVDCIKKNTHKPIKIYRLKSESVRNFLDTVVQSRLQKHDVDWCSWILKLNQASIKEFLHHFWLADGHKREKSKSLCITQNKGNICDAVALAANLCGYKVTQSNKTDKCVVLNLNKNAYTTGQRLTKRLNRKTDVFCLTVENSTFVMRQNNFITITGNCTYGATAPKVAKIIGSSEAVGELVYNAFWDAAFPLAALKSALTKYWETTAKKLFVLGIDGSKVVTRSPHALLNSLFQSAGVLCAKRAMVIHDRKLKEEGYSVDFFVDDWKNKKFCQQLIAYHDEAQGEISRELVRIKAFDTEDEAILWKEATQESKGIILSDIGHMNDKFIVGYSRPAELAVIAVKEASDYYKLNVDLTAGYILGKNWGDCH